MFLSVVSVSDSVVLKADVHVDKCESQGRRARGEGCALLHACKEAVRG